MSQEKLNHELAKLANELTTLPVDAPAFACCNHLWLFSVHRYHDGFYVLWSRFEEGFMAPPVSRRDIGRFFADPIDLINFILGDESRRFVLETQD